MAVTLTGTGGLFTRLGKLFGTWEDVQADAAALVANLDDIVNAYATDREFIAPLRASEDALLSGTLAPFVPIRAAAVATLIGMVNDDTTVPGGTLGGALRELVRQMNGSSDSVDASDVGVTLTAGSSNTGNGDGYASVSSDGTQERENAFAETIEARCVVDGYSRSRTGYQGRESWEVKGGAYLGDSAYDWDTASGSGGLVLIRTVSGTQQGANGVHENMTVNGDFETFTVANTPDNWSIRAGVAGTTIFSVSTYYRGSKALKFTGDGSTLMKLEQPFLDSSGTPAGLHPLTWYQIRFAMRRNGTVTGGVFRVSITDAGGSVQWSSSVSVTCSTLTTSYATYAVRFRTDDTIPSGGGKLTIEFTTALPNTEQVYVDELCMCEMAEVYPLGPLVAIFAGAADYAEEDRFALAVTNDRAGKFQSHFQRFFGTNDLGILLPSDTGGSETISDTLVS